MSSVARWLLGPAVIVLVVTSATGRQGGAVAPRPAQIAAAIDELGDIDFDVRSAAEQRLERWGDWARDALAGAMSKHTDLEVRQRAKLVLTRICEAKVSRLTKQLAEKDVKTRDATEKELQKILATTDFDIEKEAARSALVRASIKHTDPAARRTANRILIKAYSARVKELIPELGAEEYVKRQAASAELLKIGTPALGALKEALQNPDLEIRNQARRALEAISKSGR